jgi:hypothetical protein
MACAPIAPSIVRPDGVRCATRAPASRPRPAATA